jgi:transposase
LRSIIKDRGSENIVYIDESGFNQNTHRTHAWSKRGKQSYGDRSGARKARVNLIAAKRKNDLLAPILYEGSTCATWFNEWLCKHLMKTLAPKSTLIMDNAAFHKKDEAKAIAQIFGHDVLFLPLYSPDLNPIEQDFAIMKKRRVFADPGTTIDDIVKSYGSN